jgi:hypothetical protein
MLLLQRGGSMGADRTWTPRERADYLRDLDAPVARPWSERDRDIADGTPRLALDIQEAERREKVCRKDWEQANDWLRDAAARAPECVSDRVLSPSQRNHYVWLLEAQNDVEMTEAAWNAAKDRLNALYDRHEAQEQRWF